MKNTSAYQGLKHAGFTLMELLAIVSLLAILSAVAFARLNVTPFREAGFDQELRSAIRFAQKFAMTSGCDVQVVVDTTGYALNLSSAAATAIPPCPMGGTVAFDTPLRNPATGGPYSGTPSGGVSVTGSLSFVYDRQGRPSAGGQVDVGSSTITVEPDTGFVY